MCHQIYMALQRPLALMPSSVGENLRVELLTAQHPRWEALRTKFDNAHIYHVSSSIGGSRALRVPFTPEDISDEIIAFYNFLISESAAPIEVYSCRDGDENEPVLEYEEFDPSSLSEETGYLPTGERRFILVQRQAPICESSGDCLVHFANVDLDIDAGEGIHTLLEHFSDWCVLVGPEDTGTPFVRYELFSQCADAEEAILQFCETIALMPPHVEACWYACSRRIIDIGYHSGNEGNPLTNELSLTTLSKLSKYFTGLVITIYPM